MEGRIKPTCNTTIRGRAASGQKLAAYKYAHAPPPLPSAPLDNEPHTHPGSKLDRQTNENQNSNSKSSQSSQLSSSIIINGDAEQRRHGDVLLHRAAAAEVQRAGEDQGEAGGETSTDSHSP